jgi:hypothetical protein
MPAQLATINVTTRTKTRIFFISSPLIVIALLRSPQIRRIADLRILSQKVIN